MISVIWLVQQVHAAWYTMSVLPEPIFSIRAFKEPKNGVFIVTLKPVHLKADLTRPTYLQVE